MLATQRAGSFPLAHMRRCGRGVARASGAPRRELSSGARSTRHLTQRRSLGLGYSVGVFICTCVKSDIVQMTRIPRKALWQMCLCGMWALALPKLGVSTTRYVKASQTASRIPYLFCVVHTTHCVGGMAPETSCSKRVRLLNKLWFATARHRWGRSFGNISSLCMGKLSAWKLGRTRSIPRPCHAFIRACASPLMSDTNKEWAPKSRFVP